MTEWKAQNDRVGVQNDRMDAQKDRINAKNDGADDQKERVDAQNDSTYYLSVTLNEVKGLFL